MIQLLLILYRWHSPIFINSKAFAFFLATTVGLCILSPVCNAQLEETIAKIKPSIVGIGTYQKMNSPPVTFRGTGFVVGDGLHVVTNSHVIPETLDLEKMEKHVVITGKDSKPELRNATVLSRDKSFDLALLKISGSPLPVMQLGESDSVREGRKMAYTGFPIGMILGFFPVTHQGIISSITPIIRPAHNAGHLNAKLIKQLQSPFLVFQLDGVAYPGNSGSPLYDPNTGIVYGIINMVFVKGNKESALTAPSGISYAIPGQYIVNLLKNINSKN